MFNAFVKVIPNFYSCKANVEFIIVCFDGVGESVSDVSGAYFASQSQRIVKQTILRTLTCVTPVLLSTLGN